MTSTSRLARLLATTGLALASFAIGARRLGDFDLPWNLLTGRFVVERRAIPRIDPFAFTHQPLRYVEVAGDVALALVHAAAGPVGLQAFGGLLVATIAALVARGPGRSGAWSAAVAAATLAAMLGWLTLRPAMVSFALFATALALVELHRRAPASRRGTLALFGLAPLFALWANVHGYVTLGVALALGYLAYRAVARVARGRLGALAPAKDGTRLGASAAAVALALAGASCNTMGASLVLGPLRGAEDFAGIAEWEPTRLALLVEHEPAVLVFGALVLVGLAISRRADDDARAPSLYEAGLVAAALAGASHVVRLVPVGALVLGWVLAGRRASRVEARPMLALALSLATFVPAELVVARELPLGPGWERGHYPERAVAWIETHRPAGRMWNFWPFGGWLAFRLWPAHEVFLDGRNALARDRELVRRGAASVRDVAAFRALDAELGFEWAVTSTREGGGGAALAVAGSGFRMVQRDSLAAVYVREAGPNAALAAEGYRALTHLTPTGEMLRLAVAGGPRAADVAHDGALALAQDPDGAEAAALAACGAIATRDRIALERALAHLEDVAPGHPGVAVLRGAFDAASSPAP